MRNMQILSECKSNTLKLSCLDFFFKLNSKLTASYSIVIQSSSWWAVTLESSNGVCAVVATSVDSWSTFVNISAGSVIVQCESTFTSTDSVFFIDNAELFATTVVREARIITEMFRFFYILINRFDNLCYIPTYRHVIPSSVIMRPSEHEHSKPPSVFTQTSLQPPLSVKHSSISSQVTPSSPTAYPAL